MSDQAEMVTVFRSADDAAEDDARAIQEILKSQEIDAVVLDDSAPGVPSGAWEVQVPSANSARAEELIADADLPDEELSQVSASESFDSETVFRARAGTTSQFEAMSVKSMLEASGIAAIIIGDSVLPNLSFEVQVAKDQVEAALKIIEQAEAVGTSAAEEEERSSETPLNP